MVEDAPILQAAGYCPNSSGPVRLRGPALELQKAWKTYLAKRLKPFYTTRREFPASVAAATLARAGYLANFPDQAVATGTSPGQYGNPAACFQVYAELAEQELPEQQGMLISAQCRRRETHQSAFRLPEFEMMELVVVGNQADVRRTAQTCQEVVAAVGQELGLGGEFIPANDAFFLPSRGSQIIQSLKKLKQEYVVGSQRVAVSSLNQHETYFGDRFAITIGGQPASTLCLAFGLERLIAYSLLRWGKHPADWPAELRG